MSITCVNFSLPHSESLFLEQTVFVSPILYRGSFACSSSPSLSLLKVFLSVGHIWQIRVFYPSLCMSLYCLSYVCLSVVIVVMSINTMFFSLSFSRFFSLFFPFRRTTKKNRWTSSVNGSTYTTNRDVCWFFKEKEKRESQKKHCRLDASLSAVVVANEVNNLPKTDTFDDKTC